MKIIVYVVAWQYNTGAGFDWFYSETAANEAFKKERENVDDPILKKENWTAFRFNVAVKSYKTATKEIDRKIDELCQRAEIKYGSWEFK